MRVAGSKRRVRLTEAQLEPGESRPVIRIAPVAAALVWLGSIGVATAIYLEWLPARNWFDPVPSRQLQPPAAPALARPRPEGTARARPVAATGPSPAPARRASPPTLAEATHRASSPPVAKPLPAPKTVTEPSQIAESTRVIRGSYHSDNTHWAAGW